MSAYSWMIRWLSLALAVLAAGCTRSQYRAAADRRSYQLIESRLSDPRWNLPDRRVEPDPRSRMNLQVNLDRAPKPPDDPAAAPHMYRPNGIRNQRYWNKRPNASQIESPAWLDYLPRTDNGNIRLTKELSMDLALLHSREYQTQFESVYLNALSLTGNQFEFATQWRGGVGNHYTTTGADLGNNRLLEASDRLGFSRSLAGGGQFATELLNSFFWST